ncbi:MAG: imidazoleglycerol-phosphate dehydratase HisB [Eubacteriales bacterium]
MRKAEIKRKTNETDIYVSVNLDGEGKSEIDTGVGFFDHMLILFAKHSLMDIKISCKGDTFIDCHHTVEDVGIALGQAVKDALGEKKSITRYATCFLPMDEALAMVSMDISGRSYLVFDGEFSLPKLGDFDTEMVEDFFQAFSSACGVTLHVKVMYGRNTHHIIEAIFKAFAKAMDKATLVDNRITGVPSTKGVL